MKHARIQQLPSYVANQIAAGEVIERPASIVKELLENAIDAEATQITIEIGFGGLNQIKVSDNGVGIIAEDLPLAIAAHATSKIRQLDDLYSIKSMGFRGEALASIAAVSKLLISSKPINQDHAMMIQRDGEKFNITPCARIQGTTVDVRDIFFNAPVRKKFLKTARSEYQAIEMVVKRFALSAPQIALTLKHDGKQLLALPSAMCEKTRLLRLRKLLGKEFVTQAISINIEQGGKHLQGWVSGRTYERSQNDKQWVYINQRMVKDKLINHAIKQAYEGILHPGRHFACVVYLTIPTQEVDVNVHPTKHEVRFQQPRLVHDFILSQVSKVVSLPMQITLSERKKENHSLHEVRESYIKTPLPIVPSSHNNCLNHWVILNKHFVMVTLNEQPYLVDMVYTYQRCLLQRMKQLPRPLDHRPLLVPISYSVDKNQRQLFEQRQTTLAQLGIQLEWSAETTVRIITLPTVLKLLDIKRLIQHLSGNFKDDDLLELLTSCQIIDAYQFNQDEKIEMLNYLEQCLLSTSIVPGCMLLDTEKCRELVHV